MDGELLARTLRSDDDLDGVVVVSFHMFERGRGRWRGGGALAFEGLDLFGWCHFGWHGGREVDVIVGGLKRRDGCREGSAGDDLVDE